MIDKNQQFKNKTKQNILNNLNTIHGDLYVGGARNISSSKSSIDSFKSSIDTVVVSKFGSDCTFAYCCEYFSQAV